MFLTSGVIFKKMDNEKYICTEMERRIQSDGYLASL